MMLHNPGDRVVLIAGDNGPHNPNSWGTVLFQGNPFIRVKLDYYNPIDFQPNDIYSLEDLKQYTEPITFNF